MKISKLFHWLYAILMLLPIFFIGGRVLYTICNKNAYKSYSDTYITTTTVVSSSSLEQINNLYSLNIKTFYEATNFGYYRLGSGYFNYSNISISWNDIIVRNQDKLTPQQELDVVGFQIATGNALIIRLMDIDGNTIKDLRTNVSNLNNIFQNLDHTIYFTLSSLGTFNLGSYTATFSTNSMFMITKTLDTLDNAFDYSVNQLNTNPLFSWAQDSFLVEPFTYITNLFGVSATSPINTLLSYWLSISIIWLCFDLVMYLPLLVHRWIDKGMLE